jgi:DNA-binding transcriptional ArsR family regulator
LINSVCIMDIDLIFKALANPTRRQILEWLKKPEQFWSTEECGDFKRGVCAGQIERLGKVSQSTMSNHLSVLQQAGLIKAEKYGQWSYFSRNEELIQQYIEQLKHTL